MRSNTSSTGISHLSKLDKSMALIFGDDTCPYCNGKLEIETKKLKGEDIKVRYKCNTCGFICPIIHSEENMEVINPTYDNSIFNFLSNFGKDIRDRIKDIMIRRI